MVAGAVEALGGLRVDGDVKVDAPFAAEVVGMIVGEGERVRQVFEAPGGLRGAVTGDDLM